VEGRGPEVGARVMAWTPPKREREGKRGRSDKERGGEKKRRGEGKRNKKGKKKKRKMKRKNKRKEKKEILTVCTMNKKKVTVMAYKETKIINQWQ